jgi:hypothetical protein
MSAKNPVPSGGPVVEGPHDPEHDPRASYALEPEYAASLTERLLATSGSSVQVASPLNGAPLAHIPQSSEADVAEAFKRARVAQAAWARTTLDERAAIMLRLHDLVLERQDEIIDLIVLESGKARKHAFDEPLHIALTARYYARTAHQHLDTQRKLGVVPGLTRVEINRVPKGVVGIISPWNYPFTMALCDGLPATPWSRSRTPRPCSRRCSARGCSTRPASRRTSGRSSPGPVASSAPRSSTAPTTSASPAPRPPARSSPGSAPSG